MMNLNLNPYFFFILLSIFSVHFNPSFSQKLLSLNTKDMVLVEGGETMIGYSDGEANEKPVFKTYINSFLLDKNPVTVAQFRLFVKLNHFVTDAEKLGSAIVFNPQNKQWEKIAGAYWEYPLGKNEAAAKENEPVTQISWRDAKAYANWMGKRLPSEFEMEYALNLNDKLKFSYFKGGLWHWCENWYTKYDEDTYFKVRLNREKTLKGGSLDKASEEGVATFRTSLRLSATPETGKQNIGFRCAKDLR